MRKKAPAALAALIAFSTVFYSTKIETADYPVKPVAFTRVTLQDRFWQPRIDRNRTVTIPHELSECEKTGRVTNFELASAAMKGARNERYCSEYPFDDSDVYKVIEAASYAMAGHTDRALDDAVDSLITIIAAAQESDGYLYTARTFGGTPPQDWIGPERWSNLSMSHELYDLGHLFESAVAHFQATGKSNLLDIALRSADLVVREFGPGKRMDPPGHEEIEIGLVKLYRLTGNGSYLDLAKFFIDQRGDSLGHTLYGEYAQDHIPFVQQTVAVGHAVRAAYLYAGAADVASLIGCKPCVAALHMIWDDVVGKKIYLTGGIGAVGAWEGYGPAYHLPNDRAYAETCASIATFIWNSRMALIERDAKYVDIMERILYNGILSGISLSGDRFFYANPLASFGRHERVPWFSCSCCPPNEARILASLPGYIYAVSEEAIYVNLYAQSTADIEVGRETITLKQVTDYPWKGDIQLIIDSERAADFTLYLRIPGWARNEPLPSDLYRYQGDAAEQSTVSVNGAAVPLKLDTGYLAIQRTWKKGDTVMIHLPMEPRRVCAHPLIEADRGRVAVERGPLVYCAEWPDNDGRVSHLVLPDSASLQEAPEIGILEGVTKITAMGRAVSIRNNRKVAERRLITLIPYYAWANRGRGEMEVWISRDDSTVRPQAEPGISAKAEVTASEGATNSKGVNDQYDPESSDDAAGCMHWWPRKGSLEWIQYTFKKPVRLSEASVYWFDDGDSGECRVPVSWRFLYRDGGKWIPVNASTPFTVKKDAYNTVTFAPILTSALRIEVQLREGWSSGIQEWKIK